MTDKYFLKNTGVLKTSGNDLIDFLNRMSTNDLQKFTENEFRKTILTTDKGRIVDVITIINSGSRKIILTSAGFEQKVISHLDKYIIMDDVALEKSEDTYVQFIITGENSFQKIKALISIENDLEKNKISVLKTGEIIFRGNTRYESVNIVCLKENSEYIKKMLADFEEMSSEDYEYFRISKGIAEGENEFNDKINPMECGLEDLISFKKGCYIGQEVIARLDSQGKKPKQMVVISSDSKLSVNDIIYDDNKKEVGFISSSLNLNNKSYALGFIRTIDLDYDKTFNVLNNENKFQINISKIN